MSEADNSNMDLDFQASVGNEAGENVSTDSGLVSNDGPKFYGGPFDAPNWLLDVAYQIKAQRLLSEEGSLFGKPNKSEITEEPKS